MIRDLNVEKLLNENFYTIEILEKASVEAHNDLLTNLFKDYKRICLDFNDYLISNFTLETPEADLAQLAKATVEKLWLGMVGLMIHRNGPALLGEVTKAMGKVKDTLDNLMKENEYFTRDVSVRKHDNFLETAQAHMNDLINVTPSD